MQIAYLDGHRLRRSLIAACAYAEARRRELDRINVFPVPDGDTGTNLALTLRSIGDRLRKLAEPSAAGVARETAEAAVLGARGNSGMMLSHFLLGFASGTGERARLTTIEFTEALDSGVRALYEAIERPVEGTILTVMRETAEAAKAARAPDFVPYLEGLLEHARASLARTPELLPVLRKSGVVDAGAKGFVHLLEGAVEYVMRGELAEGERAPAVLEPPDGDGEGVGVPAGDAAWEESERYRYCTEALVKGDGLPEADEVRGALRGLGDSLVVIRTGELLKIHIHTDEPERVFEWLGERGTLATHKAEDMRAQHASLERTGHLGLARRPVSVVTESACDLPDEVLRAHGIHVVPLLLLQGDDVYRDGVDISSEEFHRRMTEREELPTTSQPSPGAFLEGFGRAAEFGEEILYVGLSSALSGTFASAEAAAARFEGTVPLHLFDSRAASILQGLLVLEAVERAEGGTPGAEIPPRLEELRARSGIFFTVDTFERLRASGRVGLGRAWLGRLLGVKPILELSPEGTVVPAGKALGRERVVHEVFRLLEERVPPGGSDPVRFGVVHVARPEVVGRIRAELRRRYGRRVEVLDGPAAPVLATHLGPGAWGLAWVRGGGG